MPVANGRSYLAIPGPSVTPEAVIRAMSRASPNIYTGELHEITDTIIPDLKYVAGTAGDVAIYITNGHGMWEAALTNVTKRGDTVLVLSCGRFGMGWSAAAASLGLDVQIEDFGQEAVVNPERTREILAADTEGKIKAVLVCQVDTSTSAKSDVAAIRKAIDAAGHKALFLVDCIASLGCDRFEMDNWGVDIMISASQKGLMAPAGVGLIWLNEKAKAVRLGLTEVSPYWDWTLRINPAEFYQYFDGTAPTHHLYALRAALDLIKAEGMEAIWDRHETLVNAIWAAVEAWGQGGAMKLNMKNPNERSHAVTSIFLGGEDGDRLRDWCEKMCGVTLGIGLGRTPPSAYFRIGHMGHVNAHGILGVLGVIDAGLKALNIPHGEGALAAASTVISKAR